MTQDLLTPFTQLLPQLQNIWADKQRQQQAQALAHAPHFNIFRLLNVAHLEDDTHSPFLADLLNPRGSHGQGYLFLSTFLHHCAQKWPQRPFLLSQEELQTGSWRIQREIGINLGADHKGFMDIVLTNHKLGCVIVIENKIYAGEQRHQLKRYRGWLKNTYPRYDQAIIFLTLDGRDPTSGQARPLSYRQDIAEWLHTALPQVQAANVQVIVKQYLAIIEAKKEETLMAQNDPLLQLILQEENLPTIRAVTEQFNTFCTKVHWQFWRELGRGLQKKLDNSAYADHWELLKMPKNDIVKPWRGCLLRPKNLLKNQNYLQFAFRQQYPKDREIFYFGICWPERAPDSFAFDFRGHVSNFSKPFADSKESTKWPLEYQLDFGPTHDEFLLGMHEKPDKFVEKRVNDFWRVFEENETVVAQINAQL